MIRISYSTVDGYRGTKEYKTLKAAQRFAADRVGDRPDVNGHIAVSFDGIVRLTFSGVTAEELFPKVKED